MPFASRGLLLGLLALPFAFTSNRSEASRPAPPAFSLPETTVAQTEAALQAGILTCHELVQGYLERIAAYDQTTHLNTVVTLNPTAFADADRLDREFAMTGNFARCTALPWPLKTITTPPACRPRAARWP